MKNKYYLKFEFKISFKLLILTFFFFSCKNYDNSKKNDTIEGTFTIEEGYFKDEIRNVMNEFNQNTKFQNKTFLITYYITNNDTIVEFSYAHPYTCENILGYTKFNGNNIFLYSPFKQPTSIKDFKINIPFYNCSKYINERDIDSPPRMYYNFKNGYIVSRHN